MNLTTKNFKLFTWLFSSIWLRKPIVISSPEIKNSDNLLDDLIHFIPQYRYMFLCGNVTKKYSLTQKKTDLSKIEDCSRLKKFVLTSFEEEKIINGGNPLQLIGFDVQFSTFEDILKHLDRGWIVSTTISTEELQKVFSEYSDEVHKLNGCAVIFLNGRPRKSPIESKLIKNYLTRSELAAQNLIQRKVGEIRHTAELLVSEIESGRTFQQAEIQELFELDNWNFARCLEIIKAEFHLDIKRYVHHTSHKIKRIHNKILEQEGIIYTCSIKNDELTGLQKSTEREVFPLRAMIEFSSYIANFNKKHKIGEIDQLSIDLTRKTKLILKSYRNSKTKDPIIFGFFLKADTPVVSFLREVDQIINAELRTSSKISKHL